MLIGAAHAGAPYTFPSGSGTQFLDGMNELFNRGYEVPKAYCTPDFATKYALQSSWGTTPTTMTQLLQTWPFVAALDLPWETRGGVIVFTAFSFVNGTTNWIRPDPVSTRLNADRIEIKAAASHLLSEYNGRALTFVFGSWEGDWAMQDSFSVAPFPYVSHLMADRFAAFYNNRQRAIDEARAETPSDCKILHAVEVNRPLDARQLPHLRRICRDLKGRIKPDLISFSAYQGTIVDQGGFGPSFAAWEAATRPAFIKAIRAIKYAFPNTPWYVGEFGFPEGIELPPGRSVDPMIRVIHDVAEDEGATMLLYWQTFDNEETSPGVPRGFYLVKPDGSSSQATITLEALL